MKRFLKSRKALGLLLAIYFAGAGVFFFMSSRVSGITLSQDTQEKVQDALTEAACPTSNSSTPINASAANLESFFTARGGAALSSSNESALTTAEQYSWTNSSKLSQNDLSEILNEVANDKLVSLSNTDVDTIAESLRGFTASGVPSAYANGRDSVILRADGTGIMSVSNFVNYLKAIRDTETAGRTAEANMERPSLAVTFQRTSIAAMFAKQVSERMDFIKAADANYFGSSGTDVTPAQAMLIYYSIAADDPMVGDASEVGSRVSSLQSGLVTAYGMSFPLPSGQKAYGDNGYIHSSPVAMLMDDTAVASFLSKVQARIN